MIAIKEETATAEAQENMHIHAALTAYAFRKSICEFQDTRMQENTRIQECNKRICDFRWHQKIQECKVENIASASDNNATMTKSKNKTNIKGDMTNMKK